MGEILAIIEHKALAGKTLNVPKEVSETGKISLDLNGQVTLPLKAATYLSTIPDFKIIKQFDAQEKSKKIPTIEINIANNKTSDDEILKIKESPLETENLDGPTIEPVPIDGNPVIMGSVDEDLANAGLKTDTADNKSYPDGDPNPKWTKPQLISWLTIVAKVEFDEVDKKEVLLGKAFKYLEANKGQE
jgi:hypothetical protein